MSGKNIATDGLAESRQYPGKRRGLPHAMKKQPKDFPNESLEKEAG